MTKVAIVTGANRGVGYYVVKTLCERLGDEGCVYLTARDPKKGQEAVAKLQKLGLNPKFHDLDITDLRSCYRLAAYVEHFHGGLDILINNAAIVYRVNDPVPFSEQAEKTIETNYSGTMQVCHYLFPLLRNNARVVNVSSGAGHLSRIPKALRVSFGRDNMERAFLDDLVHSFVEAASKGTHEKDGFGSSAYAISKVALAALTRIQQRTFDMEYPNRNIHVNSVYPGYLNNEFTNFKGRTLVEDGAKPIVYAALDTDCKGAFIWNNCKAIEWNSDRDPKDEFGTDLLEDNFININQRIIIEGDNRANWFNKLRECVLKAPEKRYITEANFPDDDFITLTSLTKAQFQIVFNNFCGPIELYGRSRTITQKMLITFFIKIRQGASDEFLKAILNYSSRQNVSLIIKAVILSLRGRFVGNNLGRSHIARDDFIANHVPEFHNILYNPEPQEQRVILYPDVTYIKIPRSSNFRIARQSYSMLKKYPLLKIGLVVGPDGYILDVHGPYFSDVTNGDRRILIHDMNRDRDSLTDWVQDGDIFVVDRGYRDALEFLDNLNLNHEIPPHLRNQRQFTTADANQTMLVTATRWIVESRNGHLKSIFKFFNHVIPMHLLPFLGDLVRIACAAINRFHDPIMMQNADAEKAHRMFALAQEPNALQQRVEEENLNRRAGGRWLPIEEDELENFPRLSLEYLQDKTFGTYQVSLAPAYIQDYTNRQGHGYILQTQVFEPGVIGARHFSRFTQATRHTIYIGYRIHGLGELEEGPLPDPIVSSYCTCKAGARTLGVCVHVSSVLWFLGFARHQPDDDIHYPPDQLLQIIEDVRILPDELEQI